MKRRWLLGLSLLTGPIVLEFFGGPALAQTAKIVALGTSFTAGRMVSNDKIWTTRLQQLLRAQGEAVEVVNQGVNGDTTRNLLARMDHAAPEGTAVVIVEYSVLNDDNGGISSKETVDNVKKIILRLRARARPPQVLLIIRGRGAENLQKNMEWFEVFANQNHVAYLAINQTPDSYAEGVHPNAEAHAQYADRLAPLVRQLIAVDRANGNSKS